MSRKMDRPAFPAGMTKQLPILLEVADTPLFQFFQGYRRSAATGVLRNGKFLRIGFLLLFSIFFIVTTRSLPPELVIVLLFFCIIGWQLCRLAAWAFHNFASRFFRPMNPRRLPVSLSSGLSDLNTHPQFAQELWIAGLRGRDIAQCLYAEGARRYTGHHPLLFLTFPVAYIFLTLSFWSHLGFVGPLLILIILIYIIVVLRATHISMGEYILSRAVQPRVEFWKGTSNGVEQGIVHGILGFGYMTMHGAFFALCCTTLQALLPDSQARGESGIIGLTPAGRGIMIVALSSLVNLLIVYLVAAWSRDDHEASLARLIAEADDAFDQHIRRDIMKDPDWDRRWEGDSVETGET